MVPEVGLGAQRLPIHLGSPCRLQQLDLYPRLRLPARDSGTMGLRTLSSNRSVSCPISGGILSDVSGLMDDLLDSIKRG